VILQSVSTKDVEIVRRSIEAFARGDLDALLAVSDPDVQWTLAADEPNPGTYRGHDGLRRFASDISEPWTDRLKGTMSFEAFIDCGDWVVVPWTARVHGRISGIPMELTETYAVQVEDGRIVRVDEYRTKAEAMEAVGPRREPPGP
jgi:ketosteroid isomerase-like protein